MDNAEATGLKNIARWKGECTLKEYKKPLITIDEGLAEGIYAASGGEVISLSTLTIENDWGNGNGQLKFTADTSALTEIPPLTITVNFNVPIRSAFGNSSNTRIEGSTVHFYWNAWSGDSASAPSMIIQVENVAAGLASVAVTGYSYNKG